MANRNRISRRDVMVLGAASAFGGASALGAPAFLRTAQAQAKTVYVNSYGGVWETSWRKAFFEPFTAQTGIQVKTVPGVSFAKLKAQVQSRNFEWDVINLGDVEYAQAVHEGLLEKVDRAAAKADELPGGDRARVRHHQLFARHQSGSTARTSSRTAGRRAGRISGM